MATVKKKLKIIDITVMNSNGKKKMLHTNPGEKIRNMKQYVFKTTDGNAAYVSHTEQEVTYEMELSEFLKYAVISGESEQGENETSKEENEEG